jgi:hypothetical protein
VDSVLSADPVAPSSAKATIAVPATTLWSPALRSLTEEGVDALPTRRDRSGLVEAGSNLPRGQGIVRAFCAERDIIYDEENVVGSYRQALSHLNLVGAA